MNEISKYAVDIARLQRREVGMTLNGARFGDLHRIIDYRRMVYEKMGSAPPDGARAMEYQKIIDYCDQQLKTILGLE